MNVRATKIIAALCTVLISTLTGCDRPPEGWTPVLEQTSTAFLRTEIEAVAARTRAARNAIASDPDRASAELDAADGLLDNLLSYYLPLLEARESAYNAYRHYYLGDPAQTTVELDKVETVLIEVAKSHSGRLLGEVDDPLEKLEDARAALGANSEEAPQALEALASRLNFLIIKGGLILIDQ